MRLIDADALIKEANADGAYGYVDAKQIADAPTVDAVEVVRCKDCKYLMFSDCYGECGQGHMGIVRPDDFCSYGERRTNENEPDGTRALENGSVDSLPVVR